MKIPLKNILWRKYTLLGLSIVLFILSLLFNKLYSNNTAVFREVSKLEKYLHHQQNDYNAFLKDSLLIDELIVKKESWQDFSKLTDKPFGIFLYTADDFGGIDMKFWSDQIVVPPDHIIKGKDGEYFEKLSNGWYYVLKNSLSTRNGKIYTLAIIPVRSEFFIETDYLPDEFIHSKPANERVKISNQVTDFPVTSQSDKVLFYLDKKVSGAVPYNNNFTLLLRFGSILFLLFFIQLFVESISRKYGITKAIGLLALLLISLRLVIYFFPLLLNLRQFEFFSPLIYGSNIVQRSLGDLFINVVLFGWIVLFAWSKLQYLKIFPIKESVKIKWVVGVLSLCLLIWATFLLASVVRSLVADSKISFDVTDFFSLNRYTLAGFFILASLSLSYYYLSQLLFRLIFPLFLRREYLVYFAIGIVGLLYLSSLSGPLDVLFFLPVLIWLLCYTWLINQKKGLRLKNIRINTVGILSWLFIFSVSIAAIMLAQNKKVEWEKRKSIAEKLAIQTDPSSEMLMSIAIKYLDNDFLSDNFYRFKDKKDGNYFRDSIITGNYSGFLNKYDTRLYVYDSSNTALDNEDPTTYEALNIIFSVQSKPTTNPDLYYYETAFDKFNYIIRREVTDSSNRKLGSFFIVSNLKNFSREALFPELFRQSKGVDPENSPIYSNAVYTKNRLISPLGNYPFATWLKNEELPSQEFTLKRNGDFDELWYRASKDKVVVIARKRETAIEAITLFSYIFCAFLFLVALVQIIIYILRTGYKWEGVKKLLQLNIRSQVHSTIIFISIFSFLIIGAATISFFISRNKQSNSEKLSRTMKIMVNEMEKKMADHNTFDDVIKIYDSITNNNLQKLVDDVSDIHGVDVNVYDLNGDLQVSSEANVYTKGVLSKKMEPRAFFHLDRLRQVQHVQEEKVGNFTYLSIYSPVRDQQGIVDAYVNIPYFTSRPELRQEISNFLVTIINLNAFIFLIAGLIALFITNRITHSFSIISNKMKEVNLGKLNEEIVWNRNDEIGDLVKEYNKMVTKLGDSATALAKSEREDAWREMARQVAHEIKNPLTPMKLSIQYLQKAINSNQPNVKELSGSVASTLVEQIDHLSKIAADFSQFANIGNTKTELFDLHDIIRSLNNLYQPNELIEIEWNPIDDPAFVNLDRTQMNRLFTNLYMNAEQACKGNSICYIKVSEKSTGENLVITIEDNGEGIAEEIHERIFIPNFTTKSSGTGLGLAMCKGIVEQAKGKIWFETEKGKGTKFFVELPLAT